MSHTICERRTTPWKLKEVLEIYQEGKGPGVAALVAPLIVWCVMASIQGTPVDRSKMALSLPAISSPSVNLRRAAAARLDGTIGARPPPQERPGSQDALRGEVDALRMQVSLQAMREPNQTPTVSGEDMYMRGVESQMRHAAETDKDTIYKRFTNAQKYKLCGFCCVSSWEQVPEIWTRIEATRTDLELRELLMREWTKKESINISMHRVYWSDDLLTAIRTMKFTGALLPSFLTAADGIQPLAWMQRTQAEMDHMERHRQEKGKVTVWSYADAKADRNAPRLPPVLPADGDAFLTTYAIGQEMLFGSRNTHVCGLNDVRGKLKMLGSNRSLPKLLYLK